MRVLFWKFHCPSFICFCKSSPLSLPTPCPLDLENTQHVSSTLPSFPNAVEELSNEKVEDEKERVDVQVEDDVPPRSSLKKPSGSGSREIEKGKVQWMDFLGKELVEIREFEPSQCLLAAYLLLKAPFKPSLLSLDIVYSLAITDEWRGFHMFYYGREGCRS